MSAIMGYAVRENIHDSLEAQMIYSISNFNPVNESAWPISRLQEKLKCCEITHVDNHYSEWQNPNTTKMNYKSSKKPSLVQSFSILNHFCLSFTNGL